MIGAFVELFTVMICLSFLWLRCTARKKLGIYDVQMVLHLSSFHTFYLKNSGLLALKHFFDLRTVKEPSSETLLRLAELVNTQLFFIRGQLF